MLQNLEKSLNVEKRLGSKVFKILSNDIIYVYYVSPGNELLYYYKTDFVWEYWAGDLPSVVSTVMFKGYLNTLTT